VSFVTHVKIAVLVQSLKLDRQADSTPAFSFLRKESRLNSTKKDVNERITEQRNRVLFL
jgi:hypothetical protein